MATITQGAIWRAVALIQSSNGIKVLELRGDKVKLNQQVKFVESGD